MDSKKRNWLIGSGIAAVIATVVVCFFCCKGRTEKYCTVIPKNAFAVAKLDGKLLMDNCNEDWNKAKKELPSEAVEILENCGVDLAMPLYAFGSDSNDEFVLGVVASMKSAKDLKKLLKEEMHENVSKSGDAFVIENRHVAAVFDDEKLLVVVGDHVSKKTALKWFKQDSSQSIVSTSKFSRLEKVDAPVVLLVSLKDCYKLSKKSLSSSEYRQFESYIKMAGVSTKDLDKDVVLSLNIFSN